MWTEITSSANKTYKYIKALGTRSHRDKYNQYVIEGLRLVEDAIKSSVTIDTIVVSEHFLQTQFDDSLIKERIKYFKISDQMFREIAHTETPQGIIAIVSVQEHSLEDILATDQKPFLIFCDSVQDPGNMGTIIRTADAAGASGVILSKGCVDIYNPKTVRSTMGSLFHIPVVKVEDTQAALVYLKEKGISIVAGYLSTEKYHFDVDYTKAVMLIIGNEANGISTEVINLSDELVKIPIVGEAESLNAGVASAVMMYEVVRQRIYKVQ